MDVHLRGSLDGGDSGLVDGVRVMEVGWEVTGRVDF